MKKIILLSMGLLSLLLGYSQNGQIKPEQEIMKLMKDWMIAVMKRDVNTLNKIVAPEFKLDDASKAGFDNPPVPRDIWMMNGMQKLKVDSVHYDKMKVDIIDNVAMVKSTLYLAGSFQGKSFIDSTSILIDTWMKRKDGWQVVSRIRVD